MAGLASKVRRRVRRITSSAVRKSLEGSRITYLSNVGADWWEDEWIERVLPRAVGRRALDFYVFNAWEPSEPVLAKIARPDQSVLIVIDERSCIPDSVFERFSAAIRVGYAHGEYPQNVVTIPLFAPRTTVHIAERQRLRSPQDRSLAWSFLGARNRRDREAMLHELTGLTPNQVHTYTGWLPKVSLRSEEYMRVLGESVFAPCPFGSAHVETYRAYEASLLGTIPVVTEAYYREYFGAPFVEAGSWAEAAEEMARLLGRPRELAELHRSVVDWTRNLPDETSTRLEKHLAEFHP